MLERGRERDPYGGYERHKERPKERDSEIERDWTCGSNIPQVCYEKG